MVYGLLPCSSRSSLSKRYPSLLVSPHLMGLRLTRSLWLTCATISLLRAEAGFIDVILDDADDSIQYIPSYGWVRGELCGGCAAKPDPSLAREGTWTDTRTLSSPVQTAPSIRQQTKSGKVFGLLIPLASDPMSISVLGPSCPHTAHCVLYGLDRHISKSDRKLTLWGRSTGTDVTSDFQCLTCSSRSTPCAP